MEEAQRLLDELAEAGLDYDDVVAVLEAEGVQKFADSFAELMDGIVAKTRTWCRPRRDSPAPTGARVGDGTACESARRGLRPQAQA